MKKFAKVLAIIMTLAISAAVFAACGSSGNDSKADSDSKADNSAASSQVTGDSTSKPVDYSNPTVTIKSGDYNGMKSFANEMLEGRHDGEVIRIDGISTRSSLGVKGSILISDGKSSKIGVTYKITGVDSIEKYPAEDAEVVVTGVIKSDENGLRYIEVPEDKVELKE